MIDKPPPDLAGHAKDFSRRYHIRFRYGDKPFKRSPLLEDDREAERVFGTIEEAIKDLKRGRLEMPPDADPAFRSRAGSREGNCSPEGGERVGPHSRRR